MKASRYNHAAPLKDGTLLLFNAYTVALLAFPRERADCARSLIADPGSPAHGDRGGAVRRLLARHGFLVPDDADELALLRHDYQCRRKDTRSLSLTIAPTLACNLACSYCYEGPGGGPSMTRETEEALVSFASSRLQGGGKLRVAWYGGEPLLRLDTIERLSESFIALGVRRGADFGASIVTNGMLLTAATAARLAELKVGDAQVTLDGPPEVHDGRRALRGGGGTFRTILENVKAAADALRISIRVNVDAANRDSLGRLLDLLAEEGLAGRISIYPGRTRSYDGACADVANSCLGGGEFSLAALEFSLEASTRGFPDLQLPAARDLPCGAVRDRSFVVAPDGGLVTCWHDVADPGARIGHLRLPETVRMRTVREERRSFSPFDRECRECTILPLCMGHCPLEHRRAGGSPCPPWKDCTDGHILNYYRLRRLRAEKEIEAGFQALVASLRTRRRAGSEPRSDGPGPLRRLRKATRGFPAAT